MARDESLSAEYITGLEALKFPDAEPQTWHDETERLDPTLIEFLKRLSEDEESGYSPHGEPEKKGPYDGSSELHFSGMGPLPMLLAREGAAASMLKMLYDENGVPEQIHATVEGSSVDVYLQHKALADFGNFYAQKEQERRPAAGE